MPTSAKVIPHFIPASGPQCRKNAAELQTFVAGSSEREAHEL